MFFNGPNLDRDVSGIRVRDAVGAALGGGRYRGSICRGDINGTTVLYDPAEGCKLLPIRWSNLGKHEHLLHEGVAPAWPLAALPDSSPHRDTLRCVHLTM